jgi:hypothetical protein
LPDTAEFAAVVAVELRSGKETGPPALNGIDGEPGRHERIKLRSLLIRAGH